MSTETKESTGNSFSETKVSQLSIENESLKGQVVQLKTQIDEISKALKQANDVIEADIKGRLSTKILANSKYTVEDLSRMSVDEMKGVEKVLSLSNTPFKGIRPGVGAVDQTNATVPDKFAFGQTPKEGE